jgi:hypothetical protein
MLKGNGLESFHARGTMDLDVGNNHIAATRGFSFRMTMCAGSLAISAGNGHRAMPQRIAL